MSIGVTRGLVQLFSLQLSAKWVFQAELAKSCDLLLCDVDTHAGEQAWRRSAGRIRVRAMATSEPGDMEGLILHKPLRADGLHGLIQILNESARIGSGRAHDTRPSPPLRAKRDTVAAYESRHWASGLVQRLLQWWFAQGSAPEAAPAALLADVPVYQKAFMPRRHDAVAVGDHEDNALGAVPFPARPNMRNEQYVDAVSSTLVVAPVLVGGMVPFTPMERSDPRLSQGIVRVPQPFSLVTEAVEDNLLTALRRFRSLSQVAVIRFDDMPTICVTSATEMFYSLASLQTLYEAPAVKLTPARVTIARNSHQGRTEAQSYYQSGSQTYFVSMPGAALKHLFWVATLRCGGIEEVRRYQDAFFRVQVQPEFALLPHERHHVTWCNLLARQPVTLSILAAATGHTKAEAAIFLAACDELGILERREANLATGMRAIANDRPADRPATPSLGQRLGLRRD